MKRVKLLIAMSLLFGVAAMASADEVISIDINNYGNDTAYTGEAAIAGATEWRAYYGGWGTPVGSPGTADLAVKGDIQASTYEEQVWVGDQGGHDYISGLGDGLLDDGFINNSATKDPNFVFVNGVGGTDAGAYSGTFDVYVYGNSEGSFTLVDPNGVVLGTDSVTGTTTGFVEGENYVVFPDITIAEPDTILLKYSNELNGIQLVSKKEPFAIIASIDPNDNLLDARNYDVAYDTNARGTVEQTNYGPDLGDGVHYLDTGEYMEYEIVVDAANEGEYEVSALVVTQHGAANISLYVDGVQHGILEHVKTGDGSYNVTTAAAVNLFEGTHTLKWAAETNAIYFGILELYVTHLGDISINDCDEVKMYGLVPAGDINGDCRVDITDLELLANEWTENYINQ